MQNVVWLRAMSGERGQNVNANANDSRGEMERAASRGEMEDAASRAEASGKLARWGHLLFRWRSFTPVPLLLLALPILWTTRGHASPLWLAAGLLSCIAGQLWRVWTIGQVPDGTSGQNEKLIATGLNQSGPYAHSRNPLYLGNLGISLGLALITHSPLLVAILCAAFFLQYAAIISVEEAFLRERFGAEYDAFCARVPRFWPRLSLPADSLGAAEAERIAKRPWSLARAIRKEHNPACAWILLAILFVALDRLVPALRAHQAIHFASKYFLFLFIIAIATICLWLAAKAWKHRWLSGNFVADLKRRARETAR